MAPIAFDVDLGISEALRLVHEIISRRGRRNHQVMVDVLDDVEAADIVVEGSSRGSDPPGRMADGRYRGWLVRWACRSANRA